MLGHHRGLVHLPRAHRQIQAVLDQMDEAIAQQHLDGDPRMVEMKFGQLAGQMAAESVGRANPHMPGIAAFAAVKIGLHRLELAHDAAGMAEKATPSSVRARPLVERRSSTTWKWASSMLILRPTMT
jgi:hypothetical protein